MAVTIQDLATQVGLKGTPTHRIAEPSPVRGLPVIDNTSPSESNIRTSVDCYVSGQYVQRNGKTIEVTQRYTIFVAYSKETQQMTMNQLRNSIVRDFEDKYGNTFNVTNVWVDTAPVPTQDVLPGTAPGDIGDLEMYEGSSLFREMTRFEKARYEIGTQRTISRTNIENIKERYGVGRR